MRQLLLLTALILIACGQEKPNNESFDSESEGLRVRYDDAGPMTPSAENLFSLFKTAINCADRFGGSTRAGMPVNPPLVVIVPPGINDPFDGLTFYNAGTIAVERQWVDDHRLWIHEFERWISFSRGVPIDEVDNAPELQLCERLV